MHLVALLVFYLDMLETMYTMPVLLGLTNVLNIQGRHGGAISYAREAASRFKNCLGPLDGTYIKVHLPADDIPRYRSRKNEITANVLSVCTPSMQFICVLPMWKGFAANGRVLRDVITKRNGLKVSQGNIAI
ncbi:hypothetical protein Pint_20138 [Pistacia integerrima]|uniref:Uncharacterized protein n=1 Tax=Pistacia integerrima TaxID=434235 RepID=A0ACC0XES3_9ROSI|nr:hypothetical protein Pint_20138 [Pistacia integerrima]